MKTLIRGKGEETYAWYHVVDYKKRDGGKHFSRGYFVHVGRQCFSFSLSLRTSLALIDLEFSSVGDDDFSFSIALYKLFFFHFAIAHLPIVKKLPGVAFKTGKYDSGEREIRLSWRPWWWHWNIWTDPGESKRRWNEGSFDLADFLLGRPKYCDVSTPEQDAYVQMPEGPYPAKVKFVTRTWKRARWPTPKIRMDADVDMLVAIPVPGKGENSWDMDDDAIYGIGGIPASTVGEALAHVRNSAMRDRKRLAGEDWMPDKGFGS